MKSNKKLFIVLITGPMGSGKTTVSKILHSKLKRTALISLDHIKKFISDFKRETKDNEISRNVILAMTKEYLRQNISVIIEQALSLGQINKFQKIADKYKANYFVYQLDAPRKILEKRIKQRTEIPGKQKVSKERIVKNYNFHLENKYSKAIILDSEKLTPEKIASLIIKDVKNTL
ncbi:MAG: AAA family ATPase [Candidatus Paceibacterota bacterium]|jgi:predicted ABC-type ATPase